MHPSHPLLPRGRRFLAAVIVLLLLAPSLGMLASPYRDRSVMERRLLARFPPPPRRPADWTAYPGALDAYFRDHFSGRERLIFAHLWLNARVRLKPASAGGTPVLKGEGDWLLLEPGLEGATGGKVNPKAAQRYAGFVCGLAADLRARRIPFLFAPAPGPAEIYPEAVPDWVPTGPVTQPELVLRAARACGVAPLDLRPAMQAAKGQGRLYQHHDSHWSNIGALVAFNGMARALGQEGWSIAPEAMGWRPMKTAESDLVRLSGLLDLPAEILPEPPQGPDARPTTGQVAGLDHGVYPPAFLQPPGRGFGPDPTVLIIGDSYTSDFMPQYFRRAGVRLAWIHQADCRFDRRIFDRVRPDFVVLMPADRQEACR
jgi:hypothetical protein